MNTDLWNKMVEETMSYKVSVDTSESFDQFTDEAEQSTTVDLKDRFGVTYYIDLNETELSLRVESQTCLQTAIENHCSSNPAYFETSSFELAEVLADHYHQKRFRGLNLALNGPTEEDFLWWLKVKNENEFELIFGSGRSHSKNEICLGYLGDESIAFERFLRSEPLFTELGVKVDSQRNNRIQFSCFSSDTEGSYQLKALFETGEGLADIYESLGGNIDLTMHFYLREIAGLRKFWLNFCHELKNSTQNPLIH